MDELLRNRRDGKNDAVYKGRKTEGKKGEGGPKHQNFLFCHITIISSISFKWRNFFEEITH